MIPDDTYYINKTICGDRQAFESLYRRYVDRIYGYVFDLVKSTSYTQDIVQEVFIAVWEHRAEIDPSLSFKSYLFTIARRRVLNEFRRQVNQPLFIDFMSYNDALLSKDETVSQSIDFDLFRQQLAKAKKQLTERQREIFELYVEQGFSAAEIAVKLQINTQTVRNSMTVSRAILRKELDNFSPLLTLLFSSVYFS